LHNTQEDTFKLNPTLIKKLFRSAWSKTDYQIKVINSNIVELDTYLSGYSSQNGHFVPHEPVPVLLCVPRKNATSGHSFVTHGKLLKSSACLPSLKYPSTVCQMVALDKKMKGLIIPRTLPVNFFR